MRGSMGRWRGMVTAGHRRPLLQCVWARWRQFLLWRVWLRSTVRGFYDTEMGLVWRGEFLHRDDEDSEDSGEEGQMDIAMEELPFWSWVAGEVGAHPLLSGRLHHLDEMIGWLHRGARFHDMQQWRLHRRH